MDDNGLSDPYVILRILPEHKAIKSRTSNRLNETLNPVFNQTFELYVVLFFNQHSRPKA